ncbi:citrate/2-methylcitrate synthase [Thermoactinospora rubra]|uniref:citrate/2-methylcitrate synthase n=1 Tax=Thermoactinospora rubra TaxID=1088767 RepID=UPI000A1062B9|nr:citrate/2-methylcitrate synthase [Thermoactinospora rubra]
MEWIDASEAARRLGVKPATLYAYVSRGVLRRRRAEDGRRSLFDAEEVERLARRGRPRHRPPELVIESAVTALGADRPYYRGTDALELARTRDFESVAEALWGTGASGGGRWESDPEALRAAAEAQRGLPAGLLPLDRLQVVVTVLGATDSLRYQLDPVSAAATGRRLIAGLVDALPPVGESPAQGTEDVPPARPEDGLPARPEDGSPAQSGDGLSIRPGAPLPAGPIAERLWPKLSPHPPTPALLRALQAALVLLADHELAASTLAARVAASAKADPYAVVLTGLGVLGGPLHGGASYAAERLLAEVADPAQASRVVTDRVRRGERVPGFGHTVYRKGDGRAVLLMELVEAAAPGHGRIAAARAVQREMARRRLPAMNVDFALATLAAVSGMTPGAGEAIFAVARTAGWLAHAMEEYAKGTLLRPRASYTGPPPRPTAPG